MKILFAGSPKPSSEVLEYISKNTPHEVVGVITQPDKRRKRGNLKVESDVSRVAKALAIKTYKPFNLDEEFKDIILGLNFDILLVSAYGKILPLVNWNGGITSGLLVGKKGNRWGQM